MAKRRMTPLLLGIALIGVMLPVSAAAECWSHYRETTLAQHLARFPLAEYERWNHYAHTADGRLQFANSYLGNTPEGAEASIPLRFSAEIRPATPVAKQVVDHFGGEEVAKLFNHELHIAEQGFDGWILVQEPLVSYLKAELKRGDRFTACLVLIGRTADYQLYIMNEFEKSEPVAPKR